MIVISDLMQGEQFYPAVEVTCESHRLSFEIIHRKEDNQATGGDGGAINAFFGGATVIDSTFSNNTAGDDGGAISSTSFFSISFIAEDLVVSGSTFTNNSAGDDGGALFALSNTGTSVNDTLIEGNFAGRGVTSSTNASGGGIFARGGLFISDSRILSNRSLDGGGGINSTDIQIADSLVSENVTRASGGGIQSTGDVRILNTTLSSNRANNPTILPGTTTSETFVGGGLHATNGEVFISESDFISNFAGHGGGAVATGNRLRVVDSNFTSNRVFTVVAPVVGAGETFSGGGGAILHNGLNANSTLVVAGSIFRGNAAFFGAPAFGFGARLPLLGGGTCPHLWRSDSR